MPGGQPSGTIAMVVDLRESYGIISTHSVLTRRCHDEPKHADSGQCRFIQSLEFACIGPCGDRRRISPYWVVSFPTLACRRSRSDRYTLAIGSFLTSREVVVPSEGCGKSEVDDHQVSAEVSRTEMDIIMTGQRPQGDEAPCHRSPKGNGNDQGRPQRANSTIFHARLPVRFSNA